MALRIDIVTLFVEMFDSFLQASIVGRAIRRGLVEVTRTNIRDFTSDSYGKADDAPYGGGVGMVLMCQPVFDAVEFVRSRAPQRPAKVVLLSPQGRPLDQELVQELSGLDRMILIAGHYEGFDERIRTGLVDLEVSLGDFVLSGGEVPAMAMIDAMVRLLPGALGKDESTHDESFSHGLLEYPQYTRPREFRGMPVPDVLVGGDHAKIVAWRKEQAENRTMQRRPDLWEKHLQRQNDERRMNESKT